MGVADRITTTVAGYARGAQRAARAWGQRDNQLLGFNEWLSYFSFGGIGYGGYGNRGGSTSINSKQEVPIASYEGYIQHVYKTNGVIFACMVARMLLFSEARFQYREFNKGRPGKLFGDASLRILEHPTTNSTTGDMLNRVIQDADLAGNHFSTIRGGQVRRLRPDWVGIIIGSNSEPNSDNPGWEIDAAVVGYAYFRGGYGVDKAPEILLPSEVAHFAPLPDPMFLFRGMSWITPVVREVMGDSAATEHKLKFFENGATPNLLINVDKTFNNLDTFKAFVKKQREEQEGVANAYKTLYMGMGSSATVIGANMKQVDFKVTQGAGETRIAAAARIPPIIVGLSEGLGAATYSNYEQAVRAFADGTMRTLWRNVAGSFSPLVRVPGHAELWYDDRDIKFLQRNDKDAADINFVRSQAIRQLVDAGFEPESVIAAIEAGDLSLLKHSGLYSVQLQSPGAPKLPEANPGTGPAATPKPAAIAPPTPVPALPATVPPPKPAAKSVEVVEFEDADDLTPREQQVRDRLARHMSNKQIAAELDLSPKTVENHVNAILRKLGVSSRTEVQEIHVHVPASQVSVTTPITVAAAPAPQVTVPVNVAAAPAPQVTVPVNVAAAPAPQVTVPITVEAAPATVVPAPLVTVNAPVTVAAAEPIVVPAPQVTVNAPVTVPPPDLSGVADALRANGAIAAADVVARRDAEIAAAATEAATELVTEKEVLERDPANGLVKKTRETTRRKKTEKAAE